MTAIRKFCLMLATLFGLTFAASSVALATPPAAQAGADGEIDCDEQPEHPDCQEEDWR